MNRINRSKKQYGFTMIELLGAIVILGILSIITIAGVTRIIDSSKNEGDKQIKHTLEMAAEAYIQQDKTVAPKNVGETVLIKATDLKDHGYITENVINTKKVDCTATSYVIVSKKSKSKYGYKAAICDSSKDLTKTSKELVEKHCDGGKKMITDMEIRDMYGNISREGEILFAKIEACPGETISSINFKVIDGNKKVELFNSGDIQINDQESYDLDLKIRDYDPQYSPCDKTNYKLTVYTNTGKTDSKTYEKAACDS